LGRLVHEALDDHYRLKVPAAAAFITLAMAAQTQLEKDYGALWPEQLEALREDIALGSAMMRGYEEWAEPEVVLATETFWEIPLVGRIRIAGRYDMLVERDDGLWVLDFKTTKYTNVGWTTQDLQASIYVWAARQMYGKDVRGIIFRFILKKCPNTYPDLVLKSGKLTKRKSLASTTTYKDYLRALAIAAMREVTDFDVEKCEDLLRKGSVDGFEAAFTEQRKAHWEVLQSLKNVRNPFFWDVKEYRTDTQLHNYMKYVIIPAAREMVSQRKGRCVGPTGLGTSFSTCRNCSFKMPCQVAMEGGDYQSLLREDYKLRDIYEKDKGQ
jgi:hypothetical protein